MHWTTRKTSNEMKQDNTETPALIQPEGTTPGPWTSRRGYSGSQGPTEPNTICSPGIDVASLMSDWDDGKLLAAAPVLYDRLIRVRNQINTTKLMDPVEAVEWLQSQVEAIGAVLASAGKESSPNLDDYDGAYVVTTIVREEVSE